MKKHSVPVALIEISVVVAVADFVTDVAVTDAAVVAENVAAVVAAAASFVDYVDNAGLEGTASPFYFETGVGTGNPWEIASGKSVDGRAYGDPGNRICLETVDTAMGS